MTLLMEREQTGIDASSPQGRAESLIELAFAAGEEGALKAAYDQFGRLVFSIAVRSLDREAAAEVTQDTFVAAWKSHGRYDPGLGSLAGWLAAIAKNKVIDELRRQQRRVPLIPGDDPDIISLHVESQVGPDTGSDDVADRMLVAEALDTLPDRARRAVEMAFIDGYSHGAIAEQTGVALGTVKSDIKRGLERMRRYLEGQDG